MKYSLLKIPGYVFYVVVVLTLICERKQIDSLEWHCGSLAIPCDVKHRLETCTARAQYNDLNRADNRVRVNERSCVL